MTGNDIRLLALEAVHAAGKGHIGGVLSCADILAAIYSGVLRPQDRFLMSKGHCAVGWYAALALAGKISRAEVLQINQEGQLGEHPHNGIPGIIANAGSLGHGLGLACGLAFADKLSGSEACTYVLLGDGCSLEGSTWEAAMFGACHALNIRVIVDTNSLIVGGSTQDIAGSNICTLQEKFDAFGWDCEIINGHDEGIIRANLKYDGYKAPLCFLADTVKGKGVSFMEGRKEWHHGSISKEQIETCRRELA